MLNEASTPNNGSGSETEPLQEALMAIATFGRRYSAALLALTIVTLVLASPAAAQKATEWGWPLPYEKVSDKSVTWLKEKGWWPLTVAFQPPWSGQSTVNIV